MKTPLLLLPILLIIFMSCGSEVRNDMKETNIAIVRKFFEDVINKGDMNILEEIFSENFTDHYASPDLPKGIGGFKLFLTRIATAFPDIQATVEDIFSDKDKVVVRLSFRGTQTGELMGGIPPSGKPAVWTGIDIFKLSEGKITDRWSQRDLLSLMRQIDAIPN
jgi:steroid delta-isomerase-like uncharacterized protein